MPPVVSLPDSPEEQTPIRQSVIIVALEDVLLKLKHHIALFHLHQLLIWQTLLKSLASLTTYRPIYTTPIESKPSKKPYSHRNQIFGILQFCLDLIHERNRARILDPQLLDRKIIHTKRAFQDQESRYVHVNYLGRVDPQVSPHKFVNETQLE